MSLPPFQPSPGRVLLRPIETVEGNGRIALLESTRDKLTPNQYEVVAIGHESVCDDEDCERPHTLMLHTHSFRCDVGDWILLRHRGTIPTDTDPYVIAWQDDVLAVLTVAPDAPPPERPSH